MEPKKSIGASNSDRFLVHVSSNPQRVRMALMKLIPRPYVYIIQTDHKNENYGFDIYVSSEWGGYPDEKMYNACKAFADNLVAPINGEDEGVVEVVELVADEKEKEVSDEHSEKAS